ncbi:MAG: cysteine synthase A, partial [Desulfobacteraceae bacterium 4572_35.1]
DIQIIAVEPSASAVLSGASPAPHKIQGIGAGFVPTVLDTTVYTKVITVSDESAINTTVTLAHQGILCGISSGANVYASQQIAQCLGTGKHVVTTLCDSGERYLSTGIFNR